MIDVDAFVSLRDVENGLRRMQLAGRDLRVLFRRVRKDMRTDQKEHAKDQAGPDGKWPALDADTLRKRSRQGKGRRHKGKRKRRKARSRRLLGSLPRRFSISYGRSWIRASADRIKWSGSHQGGDRVGRGARLPKREYLWVSTGLLAIVSRKAVDFLVGAWDKRR